MVELTSPRKIYPLPSRLWQGKVKLKRLRAESIHPPLQQLRNNPVLPCGQSLKSLHKRKRTSAMQLTLNDLRKTYLLPAQRTPSRSAAYLTRSCAWLLPSPDR